MIPHSVLLIGHVDVNPDLISERCVYASVCACVHACVCACMLVYVYKFIVACIHDRRVVDGQLRIEAEVGILYI